MWTARALMELEDTAELARARALPAHVRLRLDHYQYLACFALKEVLQGLRSN